MDLQNSELNPTAIPAATALAPQEPDFQATDSEKLIAAPPEKGRATPWRNLRRNLRGGIRLALFRRLKLEELSTTPGDLALLALTDLGLNLSLSFFIVGTDGSFAPTALPSFLFHLPLMLLCALLAGKLLARQTLITAIPVALIALSIPLELGHAILEAMTLFGRLAWLEPYLDAPHYYRFFGWWTAAAGLFIIRVRPSRLGQRLTLLLLLLVMLVIPLWLLPRGDLWTGSSAQGESGELRLTEQVLDSQKLLLDRQLAGLLPGKKGETNLYFVGFAGDASQDVFTKELSAAEQLFRERFGTQGRSITLANNPRTATTLPFATATNLDQALGRLGQVMNRDDDVLFLFLTSHGSEEQLLAVNNGPLELDELTPEMVKKMLARSGITWKAIVVSACFSGGFIDPLKDDHTLIVTAADATHESFGCRNGENFTWFGRAYFNEALRHTLSFTTAFEQAKATIHTWEEREGETSSSPQLWVGPAMQRKLASLEQGLAAREGKKNNATGTIE